MARCHRIGQEKDVTVYRLICKDTYEQTLFSIASRKYGECLSCVRCSLQSSREGIEQPDGCSQASTRRSLAA